MNECIVPRTRSPYSAEALYREAPDLLPTARQEPAYVRETMKLSDIVIKNLCLWFWQEHSKDIPMAGVGVGVRLPTFPLKVPDCEYSDFSVSLCAYFRFLIFYDEYVALVLQRRRGEGGARKMGREGWGRRRRKGKEGEEGGLGTRGRGKRRGGEDLGGGERG